MKNRTLFLFAFVGITMIEWLTGLSHIEYLGTVIFLALMAILFQLEDMEDKL